MLKDIKSLGIKPSVLFKKNYHYIYPWVSLHVPCRVVFRILQTEKKNSNKNVNF